jgi:hypothetical protein
MLFLNILSQLYSPRRALASFTISRHVLRSCAFSFHLPILILLRSSFTSWSHLFLCLPLLRTPKSSPFNKHFGILSLSIRSTWPSQLSLRDFVCLTMSSPWSGLLISELDLTLKNTVFANRTVDLPYNFPFKYSNSIFLNITYAYICIRTVAFLVNITIYTKGLISLWLHKENNKLWD